MLFSVERMNKVPGYLQVSVTGLVCTVFLCRFFFLGGWLSLISKSFDTLANVIIGDKHNNATNVIMRPLTS